MLVDKDKCVFGAVGSSMLGKLFQVRGGLADWFGIEQLDFVDHRGW